MERAIVDANKGRHEKAAGYREKEPMVTSPLSTDNLNLVN